jgi:hypothetical protein
MRLVLSVAVIIPNADLAISGDDPSGDGVRGVNIARLLELLGVGE